MKNRGTWGGTKLPSTPQEAYDRGLRDGVRKSIQSVAGIMNEEALAFGELHNPVFQSMRARVKNQLRRKLLGEIK